MDMQPQERRGVYLQQYKEPALSREIRQFSNASAADAFIDLPVGRPLEETAPEDIIEVAREAKIVDERDGRRLYKKLLRAAFKEIKTVVVDALDDEPYVSSQLGPLLALRTEALEGLRAAMRATGAEKNYIVVYKNLSDVDVRVPTVIEGVPVERVGGKYPAESQIGRELGLHKPYVTLGVCSLIFLSRALKKGLVQQSTFVTVAGNCVANPTNLEVGLGMNLNQVLERCGLADNPTRVIIGGPMTGISVIDTEKTLISPTTRAVLAFKEDERDRHYHCIGCGKCINVCPQRLDPMLLYRFLSNRRLSQLPPLHAEKCVNCGTCSYICPSKLPLSTTISRYSETLRKEDEDHETDPA